MYAAEAALLAHLNRSRSFGLIRSLVEDFAAFSNLYPLTIATGTPSALPIASSAADAISSATAISVTLNFLPYMSREPM